MKLKDANEKEIFVPLDLNQTLINLKSNKSKKEIFKVNQKTSLRASMETGTHALLKYKYVIHTHPVDIIAHSCKKDAEIFFKNKLKNQNWLWVNYTEPGIPLTYKILGEIANKEHPNILILENHGLVVAGDNLENTFKLHQEIIKKVKINEFDEFIFENDNQIKNIIRILKKGGKNVRSPINKLTNIFAFKEKYRQFLEKPLFPDQVIFCDPNNIIYLEKFSDDIFNSINEKTQVIIIKNKGLLILDIFDNSTEEILELIAKIAIRLSNTEGIKYLSLEDCLSLKKSDPEIYRSNLYLK